MMFLHQPSRGFIKSRLISCFWKHESLIKFNGEVSDERAVKVCAVGVAERPGDTSQGRGAQYMVSSPLSGPFSCPQLALCLFGIPRLGRASVWFNKHWRQKGILFQDREQNKQ